MSPPAECQPAACLQVYYGGTFDPIHNGHLAIATGARDALQARVHLVPAADPPHRAIPGASARHRAQMVALAIDGQAGLDMDPLELALAGSGRPSYTVDTLEHLRGAGGPDVSLAWLIGADSLASLEQWHQWQRLFALAHVLVVSRPGSPLPQALPPALCRQVRGGGWNTDPQALLQYPAGCLHRLDLPLHAGSATAVRAAMAAGRAVDALVPAAVARYIATHNLYRLHAG